MDRAAKKYWFKAKRYGWGWGLPSAWQGWLVMIMYLVLIAGSGFLFPPHEKMAIFLILTAAITLLFIAVCWLRGEPPRWRWGNDKK